MKKVFSFLIFVSFIFSCNKKDKDSKPGNNDFTDELSDEQIQIMEQAGVDTVSRYENALFADGSRMSEWERNYDSGYNYIFNQRSNPPSDKKALFINAMTHAGFLLTYKIGYPNLPGQYGIAYVKGSKSFAQPSTYPGASCQIPLYGLDCSGMIYQMAKASGVNLIASGTVDYVKTDVWNQAFKNTDFEGLEMRDTGALDPSKIEAGDIIVASEEHIGFVFDNGNSLQIFNSLGKSSYSCVKNSDINHGPVITKGLASWLTNTFSSKYHVLRAVQPFNLNYEELFKKWHLDYALMDANNNGIPEDGVDTRLRGHQSSEFTAFYKDGTGVDTLASPPYALKFTWKLDSDGKLTFTYELSPQSFSGHITKLSHDFLWIELIGPPIHWNHYYRYGK